MKMLMIMKMNMEKSGINSIRRTVIGTLILYTLSTGAVTTFNSVSAYAAETEAKDYSFSSLQWDTSDDMMMAYWDQSEDDQHYKVQLYKDSVSTDSKVGPAVTVTNKDYYDFTKLVLSQGAGNYIFTVTGLKENETQQSDTVYINWELFHNIEDKYIGEHPKTVYGKYSVEKMEMIKRVDPVTTKAMKKTEEKEKTARDGWLKLKDADWYHFTKGAMDIGWYTDPATGDKYYFNPDGTMKTGYMYLNGQNFFFDESGKLKM